MDVQDIEQIEKIEENMFPKTIRDVGDWNNWKNTELSEELDTDVSFRVADVMGCRLMWALEDSENILTNETRFTLKMLQTMMTEINIYQDTLLK